MKMLIDREKRISYVLFIAWVHIYFMALRQDFGMLNTAVYDGFLLSFPLLMFLLLEFDFL